jgi:hypothetical protein
MAYEYLLVGTQRFTDQGYLLPTNPDYYTRIFHISVLGVSTSGTCIACLVTGTGGELTTATTSRLDYLAVSPSISSTTYCWNSWDNHYGTLFEGQVLIATRTGFTSCLVNYAKIRK